MASGIENLEEKEEKEEPRGEDQKDAPTGPDSEPEPGPDAEPEPEPEPGEAKTPVYLLDNPPEGGVSNIVKWRLMHGEAEETIVASGQNPNTVRICAQELEKDGHRKRPKKIKDSELLPARGSPTDIRTFAAGSPPEALINSITFPIDTNEGRIFERGLKAGATLLVLGVRVAQELSSIGIKQAEPIMAMSKSMREGEALAAKNAAFEAADQAAGKVANYFGPMLDKLTTPAGGSDPMKAMMVRTMEPIFQNMMAKLMPGGGAPQAPGWEVTRE